MLQTWATNSSRQPVHASHQNGRIALSLQWDAWLQSLLSLVACNGQDRRGKEAEERHLAANMCLFGRPRRLSRDGAALLPGCASLSTTMLQLVDAGQTPSHSLQYLIISNVHPFLLPYSAPSSPL